MTIALLKVWVLGKTWGNLGKTWGKLGENLGKTDDALFSPRIPQPTHPLPKNQSRIEIRYFPRLQRHVAT
jgi:hypothetical protein